jgi:capsular polysaccharide biosynthesis protein
MGNNRINENEGTEIDLLEVFHVLLGKWWVIACAAVLCGLVALLYTQLFVTPQYRSETKMYVLNRQKEGTLTTSDLQMASLLTKDYMEIIKSRTVAESVIDEMGLDLTPAQLKSKITVSAPSDARVISIAVTDANPARARDIANRVRECAAKQIQAVMDIEAVNVVDVANMPTEKYSPSLKKNTLIGALAGAVLAAGILVLQYVLNDTIKSSDDVTRYLGLSTLGSIPIMDSERKNPLLRGALAKRLRRASAARSGGAAKPRQA